MEEKVLKRQKGLGKINRAIKSVLNKLQDLKHAPVRFKRHYDVGLAIYTCRDCEATVTVNVAGAKPTIEGSALVQNCVDRNPKV